ncbi:MAG: CpaD family pilus assembly protein [Microvirga sp.]
MRTKFAILALTLAAAGCQHTPTDQPDRGLASTNVPVVTSAEYAFDVSAPGGTLAPGEAQRLDAWFQTLGLGYGDAVYVDGAYGGMAPAQVAQVAGRYGLLVQPGAPVTEGVVQPGLVRVVVSRRRAEVPGCPNWSGRAQPNFQNRSMSNYGCAMNSNLAAMVADPVDLIHGREGSSVLDTAAAARAINLYRTKPLTGAGALKDVNTKGGN